MPLGDASTLIARAASFLELSTAPGSGDLEESIFLAGDTFSCLLNASLQDAHFWSSLMDRQDLPNLIRQLMLCDPRDRLRRMMSEIVCNFYQIHTGYTCFTHPDRR